MADPEPGPGEVRVRLTRSGVNPGDTKKRADWVGHGMPYPRVVPRSDGAGVVDAVGGGVASSRIGERVWVFGAQSYRAFGTAAEWTVVPADQAVLLPDGVGDELGACLGIPGITGHRAVFGDGPVGGTTVLVHGVLGGVGSMAAQLAAWGGATLIGTVHPTSRRSTTPSRTAWRWTPPIRSRRSVAQPPTARTASLRCPSPTAPTSTPRSPRRER